MKNKVKALLSTQTAAKITEFVELAESNKDTYEEFFNRVIEFEWERREYNKYHKELRNSNIPHIRNLDEFDITRIEGLTKEQLDTLRKLEWVDNHFNLILQGSTGLGKTSIAIGLLLDALNKKKKVMFITAHNLTKSLQEEGTTRKSTILLKRIRGCDLLVIDDIRRLADTERQAEMLFDIIDELYEKASIIMTSNTNYEKWIENLGETTTVVSIMDRLFHHFEIIKLEGKSYRIEHSKRIFNK